MRKPLETKEAAAEARGEYRLNSIFHDRIWQNAEYAVHKTIGRCCNAIWGEAVSVAFSKFHPEKERSLIHWWLNSRLFPSSSSVLSFEGRREFTSLFLKTFVQRHDPAFDSTAFLFRLHHLFFFFVFLETLILLYILSSSCLLLKKHPWSHSVQKPFFILFSNTRRLSSRRFSSNKNCSSLRPLIYI